MITLIFAIMGIVIFAGVLRMIIQAIITLVFKPNESSIKSLKNTAKGVGIGIVCYLVLVWITERFLITINYSEYFSLGSILQEMGNLLSQIF